MDAVDGMSMQELGSAAGCVASCLPVLISKPGFDIKRTPAGEKQPSSPFRAIEIFHSAGAFFCWDCRSDCAWVVASNIMSGCGNANCNCGPNCTCANGCSCGRTMAVPSFGGLRNYNEPDCKCGPDCKCADCDCHMAK